MRMIDVFELHKTPAQIAQDVAARAKRRRKELGLTQPELATRAGMSLGSLRRFEQTGKVAFDALVRICIALECEDDLESLFARRAYRSIQEVIDAQRR